MGCQDLGIRICSRYLAGAMKNQNIEPDLPVAGDEGVGSQSDSGDVLLQIKQQELQLQLKTAQIEICWLWQAGSSWIRNGKDSSV